MGEIENIINLYIEDMGLFKKKVDEISLYLKEQSILTLNRGMNSYKKKRTWEITGNTMRSIETNVELDGALSATIKGYIDEGTSPYGKYVDAGHHSWEGYQFMKGGLEATLKRYGG